MAERRTRRSFGAGRSRRRGRSAATGVGRSLDDLIAPGALAPAPHATAAEPPLAAGVRALAPVEDLNGPRVRLGIAWALLTFVVAAIGPVAVALWFGATAALAAVQTGRWWLRRRRRIPAIPLTAATGSVLPFAALGGFTVFVIVAVVAAVASLVWRPDPRRTAPAITLAVGLSVGVAAASPVFARRLGLIEAIVLLSLVAAYDASAFVVGTGATRPWEGPAAGVAFVFAVTLAVAAVFVPPFRGISPWLLGLLTAILAPLGPFVASALLGDRRGRAPALRRLDSLLLAGPVWVAVAGALVD